MFSWHCGARGHRFPVEYVPSHTQPVSPVPLARLASLRPLLT